MLSSVVSVLRMLVGLIIDIITLPFRAAVALLGGAAFEFRRFSRPARRRR